MDDTEEARYIRMLCDPRCVILCTLHVPEGNTVDLAPSSSMSYCRLPYRYTIILVIFWIVYSLVTDLIGCIVGWRKSLLRVRVTV